MTEINPNVGIDAAKFAKPAPSQTPAVGWDVTLKFTIRLRSWPMMKKQ